MEGGLRREEVGGNHKGSFSLSSFVGRAVDQVGLGFVIVPHPPRHRISGVWFTGVAFNETTEGPVKKGKTGLEGENRVCAQVEKDPHGRLE